MATIQWRPAVNALTTPKSYRIQAVSRSTDGYDEMAADISAEQPIYSEETVKGLAPLIIQWIQRRLINGSQVTLPEAFSFSVSFTGKLDSLDAPLPESDDLLQVNVRVSQPFVKEIRLAQCSCGSTSNKLPTKHGRQIYRLKHGLLSDYLR